MTTTAARLVQPGRRQAAAFTAAAALAALAAGAMAAPFVSHQATTAPIGAGGFAGGVALPVRAIERVHAPATSNVLVPVRCAGRARFVSACWVSKR